MRVNTKPHERSGDEDTANCLDEDSVQLEIGVKTRSKRELRNQTTHFTYWRHKPQVPKLEREVRLRLPVWSSCRL